MTTTFTLQHVGRHLGTDAHHTVRATPPRRRLGVLHLVGAVLVLALAAAPVLCNSMLAAAGLNPITALLIASGASVIGLALGLAVIATFLLRRRTT